MEKLDGEWIQTFTGKMFYPACPMPEDICIEDIAHSLSQVNRYTGHTFSPYSVAQHCVLVSENVRPSLALTGLLHDASEAYIADVARPVKRLPEMKGYMLLEENIEKAIAEKFGLSYPWHEDIKAADVRLLMTEKRDLMGPSPKGKKWGYDIEPFEFKVEVWSPKEAETFYLAAFNKYGGRS